ncbi:hypothetical protein HCH54_005804 [Aspergillus fumigatus]
MSSSILHTCAFCGKITDVSTALAAFIMDSHCAECGLSASESNIAMQNELATLFATQMSVGSEPPKDKKVLPPIVYSITQHYHHSSHVARQGATEPMDLS